jgi:hypothetical protein
MRPKENRRKKKKGCYCGLIHVGCFIFFFWFSFSDFFHKFCLGLQMIPKFVSNFFCKIQNSILGQKGST